MTSAGRGFIAVSALFFAVSAADRAAAVPVPGPVAVLAPAAMHAEPAQFYGYRGPYWRYGFRQPFPGYRRFGVRPYGYGFGGPFRRFGGPFRPYGFRRPFRFYGLRRF